MGPFPSTIPQLPASMHRAIFAALVDVSRTYPFQPDWRGEYARYDTMFIEVDAELDGMLA